MVDALPWDVLECHVFYPFRGLSDVQQETATSYIKMLLEMNKHMNLTAVKDFDEAMVKHVEDSLALLPVFEQYAPLVRLQ